MIRFVFFHKIKHYTLYSCKISFLPVRSPGSFSLYSVTLSTVLFNRVRSESKYCSYILLGFLVFFLYILFGIIFGAVFIFIDDKSRSEQPTSINSNIISIQSKIVISIVQINYFMMCAGIEKKTFTYIKF